MKSYWKPKYPEAKDSVIELRDEELSTYIYEKKPGVNIVEYPLDNPACFFIDSERVYFRINWKLWVKVSHANPKDVEALIYSPACQIYYASGSNYSTLTAPVYRIKELPPELFGKCEDVPKDRVEEEFENKELNKRNEFIEKVKFILTDLPIDVAVFDNLNLGGGIIPFALAVDELCLILEVMLLKDIGSEEAVVEKLKCARNCLENNDIGGAKVATGIIGDANTIKFLSEFADKDMMADVHLISIDQLEESIVSIFRNV